MSMQDWKMEGKDGETENLVSNDDPLLLGNSVLKAGFQCRCSVKWQGVRADDQKPMHFEVLVLIS